MSERFYENFQSRVMAMIRFNILFRMISLLLLANAVAVGQDNGPVRGLDDLPPRFYNRVHVLCVGINRFRFPGITELNWAEADAQSVASVFTDRYGYSVDQLIGRAATKRAILQKLNDYAEALDSDDALLVFFAGHGQTVQRIDFGREGYLLAFDSELDMADTRDPDQWNDQAMQCETSAASHNS